MRQHGSQERWLECSVGLSVSVSGAVEHAMHRNDDCPILDCCSDCHHGSFRVCYVSIKFPQKNQQKMN
jgi:hypothetical protein